MIMYRVGLEVMPDKIEVEKVSKSSVFYMGKWHRSSVNTAWFEDLDAAYQWLENKAQEEYDLKKKTFECAKDYLNRIKAGRQNKIVYTIPDHTKIKHTQFKF